MSAAGFRPSRANRCFTPRKSPEPSSPTVATKQHRMRRSDPRPHERLGNGDQGGEAARVGGDPRTTESRPTTLDGHVQLDPKDRVEVGAEHDAPATVSESFRIWTAVCGP